MSVPTFSDPRLVIRVDLDTGVMRLHLQDPTTKEDVAIVSFSDALKVADYLVEEMRSIGGLNWRHR